MSSGEISVREAGIEDTPFLKAMIWEALSASPTFMAARGEEQLRQIEDDYWAQWSPQVDTVFVACDSMGHNLGALIIRPNDKTQSPEGWRIGIGVDAPARGRGVGRSLMLRAVQFARDRGARYVNLFVDPLNSPAIALYRHVGFTDVGEHEGIIQMRIDLTPSTRTEQKTMDQSRLEQLQQALKEASIDGWLFYDFRQSNPIAYRVLGVTAPGPFTRRWYYWLPAQGEPKRLVSALEAGNLDGVPGEKIIFRSRLEMEDALKRALDGSTNIAMEYSPMGELPVVAKVDAGTVEYLRSLGKNVVSSADLVQAFEGPLTPAAYRSHMEAERRLAAIYGETRDFIRAAFAEHRALTEYEVQQYMLSRYNAHDLFIDHGPIVAVGPNASNPHYEPTAAVSAPIREGDLLLIDWWGKLPDAGSVYGDYTWMGVVSATVPERYNEIFEIVRGARDAAIDFVKRHIEEGEALQGWEVDDVARAYITERGYGDYFIHRTGHSIGVDIHGSGANLDNFETRDTRQLLPHTLFSIEPGIYLPEFGVRSEVNVYIGEGTIEVTGRPVQGSLPAMLA